VAAFARRKGNEWFLGVINGGEAKELKLPLQFLGKGTYNMEQWGDVPDRDDAWSHKTCQVSSKDILSMTVRPKGGFVARLTPLP
jgi:alpha-glucosidase